ncbi:MAG TPA: flavodoxin reductase [Ignavibacteria bacterium]|nr:flavodoxin reductase [Ignavibacteria bacterium]
MEQHIVKILSKENVTHDVIKLTTSKPDRYTFKPGQATEVSINNAEWKDKTRPFTFTCLPENDYLEFNIKTYPEHKGVTEQLLTIKKNDELILHDVFGDIGYKGEGVFIAGGAGVTPFISIFRYLKSVNEIGGNKLIFANKKKADIILEPEFKKLLGMNFINILSEEKSVGYEYGHITESFLKANIDGIEKMFYLCGPPAMMDSVERQLDELNVNNKCLVEESF